MDFRSGTIRSRSFCFHARISMGERALASPAIVMVHGIGMSHDYLEPTGRELASAFHVHIPDLPGFGRSQRPRRALDVPGLAGALSEYIESAGLRRPVLFGNSFGCQVIMELAARAPELPGAVVLQGPTGDPAGRSVPGIVRRALGEFGTESPRHWWYVLLARGRGSSRILRETFSHYMQDRPEEKARLIEAPTLIVRGSEDALCPREWARWLKEQIPGSELVEPRDMPHAAVDSHPAELAAIVGAFLRRKFPEGAAAPVVARQREEARGAAYVPAPDRGRAPEREQSPERYGR